MRTMFTIIWVAVLPIAWMVAWAPIVAAQPADTAAARVERSADPEAMAAAVESMTEQLQAIQTESDRMKRFKFSGYLQARWETAENSSDTVRVTGPPTAITPANVERFYIRRARLKLTYDGSPLSQAVVYIDGGQDRTIRLLEGYVTLLDPWTVEHRHQLTVGQFNVPFGYEIERSSTLRELPERSRAENVLFAGERDRGLKLVDAWSDRFETVVAVLNGGGVNHPDFPNTDPSRGKDVVGRARYAQGIVDAAVSYYHGRNLTPLIGDDVETDKTRFGADAQIYYELPTLGGGSLKGEFYRGVNVNADAIKANTDTTTTGLVLLAPGADRDAFATDFVGGYVMWVQNLGERFQAAARVESFDPNADVDHDQFERLSLALHGFYDGFTRITVAYDVPRTDRSIGGGNFEDPEDNLWTVQFQHRF